MDICYTAEQEQLRRELREYFAGLMTPEVQAAVSPRTASRRRPDVQARRCGRWAGRVAGPRLAGSTAAAAGRRWSSSSSPTRPRGRCAGAVPDDQHRRQDDHGVRHARAAGSLPAEDRGRRDPLLDRVLRARRRHRPGIAAHVRRPGRRRIRDQRPEDVDEADLVRRLHLAGGPHRSRRAQAQGHVHLAGRPDRRPGSRGRRSHDVRPDDERTYYSDVRVPATSLVGESTAAGS